MNCKLTQRALTAALALALGGTSLAAQAAETGDIHASLKAIGLFTGQLRPGTTPATDTSLPGLALLSFDATNAGGTGVFASAYGYLQQQFASGPAGHGADLMLGNVGWAAKKDEIRFQIGRIAVFTGGAQYQYMDGASLIMHLPKAVRVDGYFGTGVYENFDNMFKAPTYGARVAWTPWELGHIGLGLQAIDDVPGANSKLDYTNRRSLSVDGSLRMFDPLTLVAFYAQDLLENRLQQARLDLNYKVKDFLILHTKAELRDPLAWMSKTSIFQAFLQRTDGMVGGSFDLITPGALTVAGGYDRFVMNDGVADGYRTFVEGRVKIDPAGRYRAGLQYARLFNGDNGYDQVRVFGSGKVMERLTVSGDIDCYAFMRAVRGETFSIRGGASARYAVMRGLDAGVDAQIWRNPYFDAQALGLLTLTVNEGMLMAPRPVPAALVSGADANEVAVPAEKKAEEKKGEGEAKSAEKAEEKPAEKAPDKAPEKADDAKPAGGNP